MQQAPRLPSQRNSGSWPGRPAARRLQIGPHPRSLRKNLTMTALRTSLAVARRRHPHRLRRRAEAYVDDRRRDARRRGDELTRDRPLRDLRRQGRPALLPPAGRQRREGARLPGLHHGRAAAQGGISLGRRATASSATPLPAARGVGRQPLLRARPPTNGADHRHQRDVRHRGERRARRRHRQRDGPEHRRLRRGDHRATPASRPSRASTASTTSTCAPNNGQIVLQSQGYTTQRQPPPTASPR